MGVDNTTIASTEDEQQFKEMVLDISSHAQLDNIIEHSQENSKVVNNATPTA